MAASAILEVQNDPQEGVVVTVDEGAAGVEIPAPCSGCLGVATKRLPPSGVSWLEFPYCDGCVRPLSNAAARKMKSKALIILIVLVLMFLVSLWFAILGLLIFADVGGQRGRAVKMLHSESGTVRLAFQNEEYARLFVEANGPETPPSMKRPAAGSVTIFAFTGEFDSFNLSEIGGKIDALIQKGCVRLVFNLRLLKFINSSALGYLIKTAKRLKELDGELVLSEPSKFFQTTIKTLGIDQIFRIYPNDQEAVKYFHDHDAQELEQKDGVAVDDKLLGSTTVFFRLLDAPETMAVGKILSIYEDGPVFTYPADPDNAKIRRDELSIGRQVWIKFRQPLLEEKRFFEMEAEIVMAVDLDDAEGTSKYRLRYTRIDEADRKALVELLQRKRDRDDEDDGTAGTPARLDPRRPSGSGAAGPPEQDTA